MKKQLIAGTALAGIMAAIVTVGILNQPNVLITIEQKQKMANIDVGSDIILESQGIVDSSQFGVAAMSKVAPSGVKRRMIMPTPSFKLIDYGTYEESSDKFEGKPANPIKKASEEPVSTFSIDVDTASYSLLRQTINSGGKIDKDSVRIEEMVNYFDYDYPSPENTDQPFKPTVKVYPTPWNKNTKLVHIGIKGYDVDTAEKPHSNLVFLLDVSGSMNSSKKLPLLKNAFRLLVDNLNPTDTVSIVTYAGSSGVVLEPTEAKNKEEIFNALNSLKAGGSTNGEAGIEQAYSIAKSNFNKDGVNRIILATDGDFNFGTIDHDKLKDLVEEKRKDDIFLSILGFGRGNYNDALMQTLAQNGNGVAAYIDTLSEARKVLVEEASSTLFTIAKDVKIQIEFNPDMVSEYRLAGYETRMLTREDFKNDKVDAGDIGSGHTVTAIYEITPVGSPAQMFDDLRYNKESKRKGTAGKSQEYAFLKIRYKLPSEDTSNQVDFPITKQLEFNNIDDIPDDFKFAVSVAAFGQKLRKNTSMDSMPFDSIIELAKNSRGEDEFGYRSEFINLVRLAKSKAN